MMKAVVVAQRSTKNRDDGNCNGGDCNGLLVDIVDSIVDIVADIVPIGLQCLGRCLSCRFGVQQGVACFVGIGRSIQSTSCSTLATALHVDHRPLLEQHQEHPELQSYYQQAWQYHPGCKPLVEDLNRLFHLTV